MVPTRSVRVHLTPGPAACQFATASRVRRAAMAQHVEDVGGAIAFVVKDEVLLTSANKRRHKTYGDG